MPKKCQFRQKNAKIAKKFQHCEKIRSNVVENWKFALRKRTISELTDRYQNQNFSRPRSRSASIVRIKKNVNFWLGSGKPICALHGCRSRPPSTPLDRENVGGRSRKKIGLSFIISFFRYKLVTKFLYFRLRRPFPAHFVYFSQFLVEK